jgi:4'-phosphopantetheinyl transferase EntD
MAPAPFVRVFALDLSHGRCVGVSLPTGDGDDAAVPAAALAALPETERRHVETLPPARRVGWVGGRLALRAALADLAFDAGPILSTPRGAPQLPAGARGSISHKKGLVVALAARASDDPDAPTPTPTPTAMPIWQVGVDLERIVPGHSGIARYVLRAEERARLPPGDDPRRVEELLFAFSAKEAVYKALDPFLGRYVSFREVSVERRADGSAAVTLFLRAPGDDRTAASSSPPAFEVDLRWLQRDDIIITTARVSRLP